MFVSATRSRLEGLWSNGGFAALSLNMGPRTAASVSAESTAGHTAAGVNVQQSPPVGPGFGYRVQASGLGAGSDLVDEVAHRMGCSRATVRVHLYRARSKLRELLSEED